MRWRPPRVVNRLVRQTLPGLRRVHAQVAVYARLWEESNVVALAATGPLWVALGDSTAQGIGASSPDLGYVGQLDRAMEAHWGQAWRVVNLSRSGARAIHVLDSQLPRLEALGQRPDLVTCAVGANDVVNRTPREKVEEQLRRIIERLPEGAVVATIPQGLRQEPSLRLNRLIRSQAEARGLVVADVYDHTGPPWDGKLAEDRFHPGALGYAHWAAAFAEALGLPPLPEVPSAPRPSG